MSFRYLVAHRSTVLIVLFGGELQRNMTEIVKLCETEILGSPEERVILDYHQVVHIDDQALESISELHRAIRKKPSVLRVCSLKAPFSLKLQKLDTIQSHEISESIEQAIRSLSFRRAG